VLAELRINPDKVPTEFINAVRRKGRVCAVEEHVPQGGIGQMLAHFLLRTGLPVSRFLHLHAKGYPSGLYGSQTFHRKECGLDGQSVASALLNQQ